MTEERRMERAVVAHQSRIKNMVYCGLSIALIAVSAWITVPFGPIPFTLQTLTVCFVIFALKPKQAMVALTGYVLLGALGLPLFSSFRGGFAAIAGPTGGFIISYIIGGGLAIALACALKQVKLFSAEKKVSFFGTQIALGKLLRNLVVGLVFIAINYAFGWAWFMMVGHVSAEVAFVTAIAPFIGVDLIKMVLAIILAQAVGAVINRA